MNPLAIRVAADLKAFKANMAEMRTQLETNASAMKRMANAFDGSKVIGDANAMVKAIHDIGGASKLTESEQKRVNATVAEALAKYKALGREAPAELLALRDATQKVEQPTKDLGSKITALGVAAGTFLGNMAWSAVNKLGSELGEFAKRGTQLNAVQSSFERLASGAGLSAQAMLREMKSASRGMVAEYDLMTAANKAMLLGLPVSVATMGELTKAATTLGRAMGQNATKSVDDLITALGRSSPMILDNLGITVKVGEANDIYAAKLKTTAEKLTDAEKKTAFYEEAMRRAKDRTEELGEQTDTLGEIMQREWTSIGDVVSRTVSIIDVGLGAVLQKNWTDLAKFMQTAAKEGVGFALVMEAAAQKAKTAVSPLTETQQALVRLNQTMGDNRKTGAELAKMMGVNLPSVLAYAKQLTDEQTKANTKLTEEQKKAAEEARKLAEAFQKQVDVLTGKALEREVADLAKQVEAAGKQGGISASEYQKLGKQLDEMKAKGAKLTPELQKIWKDHDTLNKSVRVTTNVYRDLNAILASMKSSKLSLAPVPNFTVPVSDDPYGIIDSIERAIARIGPANPKIKLAAAPVVKTWKDGFVAFMGQASMDMANSIVRAIEGGGNIVLAAMASLAQSAGQFFTATFEDAVKAGTMSKGMAQLGSGLVTGIIGVGLSIITDMFKPAYTALEQVARAAGKTTKEIEAQLRQMGAVGVKAFEDMTRAGLSFENFRNRMKGMTDAQSLLGLVDQFQTKEELDKIASQWKAAYDYMLTSGKYTAAQLAEAWKRYEDAQKAAIGAIDPEDTRPVGARGFPTKAQLQQAVREAEEAYRYVRDSGLYTADVIEQAWQQWQDAMIASGDETAKRMKDLQSEIASLQKAVEAETPEHDVNGVRMYGVEELRNIERLAALEKEKAALNIIAIENEKRAVEESAVAAALQADKEFEAAKKRANNLDDYLKKLFSGGYEIPITFRLPDGSTPGQPQPPSFFGGRTTLPVPSGRAMTLTIVNNNVTNLDGQLVARNQAPYMAKILPAELEFTGSLRR